MSYQSIDQLTQDSIWGGRVRACAVEQSETYINDARPQFVAAATDVLRGGSDVVSGLIRLISAGPGMSEAAGEPPDQSLIDDSAILAAVQAQFPTVAALYFAEDGTPL